MNANFLTIIKRIVSEQGEAILAEPNRLKGWISDYAKDEPKAERLAFGRCIEYGAYTELKNALPESRAAVKKRLAQKLYNEQGLDTALCVDALDVLEAAVWGVPEPKILCRNCGKELQAEWKACPYCGTPAAFVPASAASGSPGLYDVDKKMPEHFILIKGGNFLYHNYTMSGRYMRPQEESVKDFFIDRNEVTQEEYQQIMGVNPSRFHCKEHPVENVSFFDALNYCNKRSEKEILTPFYAVDDSILDSIAFFHTIMNKVPGVKVPGVKEKICKAMDLSIVEHANGYRLPTSVEWEYACRGDTVLIPFNKRTTWEWCFGAWGTWYFPCNYEIRGRGDRDFITRIPNDRDDKTSFRLVRSCLKDTETASYEKYKKMVEEKRLEVNNARVQLSSFLKE
jgi:formylglycine-generating enzyme required for sulfatase activity